MATPTSIPAVSRRTLLKAGAVTGSTFALSGCASAGEAQTDEAPEDDEPNSTEGDESIRIPQLHLDTLEAEVEGTTVQAVSYEDWRPGSTTYVGRVSGRRGTDIFVGMSLLEDEAEQPEHAMDQELLVYLCDGEIGAFPDIGVYLVGDYDAGGVTLTPPIESSADEDIEVKLALVDGEFLGAVTLADGEQFPFIAGETTGNAGFYKAEPDGEDWVVQWVVLPDGRQRGSVIVWATPSPN